MTRLPGAVQDAVSDLYTRRVRTYVPYVQAFAHRQGLRAVLEASSWLKSGLRILDAGCGTGLSILALLEAFEHSNTSVVSIASCRPGQPAQPAGHCGRLFAVVTRRSFHPTRWIWRCEGYSTGRLAEALGAAGLEDVTFRHYPPRYGWLNIGNLVAEAVRREIAGGTLN